MKKIIFCIVHKLLFFSKIQNFSKSVSVFNSEIKRQKSIFFTVQKQFGQTFPEMMTEQKSDQRRRTLISDQSRKSELYFLLFSAFNSEVKSELNQNFKTFVYRKTEQNICL